ENSGRCRAASRRSWAPPPSTRAPRRTVRTRRSSEWAAAPRRRPAATAVATPARCRLTRGEGASSWHWGALAAGVPAPARRNNKAHTWRSLRRPATTRDSITERTQREFELLDGLVRTLRPAGAYR